jgi:hypothetical protein
MGALMKCAHDPPQKRLTNFEAHIHSETHHLFVTWQQSIQDRRNCGATLQMSSLPNSSTSIRTDYAMALLKPGIVGSILASPTNFE